MTPRVSVVVACFNDGATLPETVDSVFTQEPVELVIVDDGSTDPATLAVFEELHARGIQIIRQKNAGLSAARNTGVAATSAPYVYALDSDDVLASGSLTALADALDEQPDAVAAWGDIELFGDTNMVVRPPAQIDPWRLTYLNEMAGTSLFRRTALVEAGGWENVGYQDWNLWLAFAERGYPGVSVPILMFRYRIHGPRMWSTSLGEHERLIDELKVRHPRLFADRARLRSTSSAPPLAKLLFPLIERLPLSTNWRQRLYAMIIRPRRVLEARLKRLARSGA